MQDEASGRQKILVIGATGRTGMWCVSMAEARGHQVRALIRSRKTAPQFSERTTVIYGDATDEAALSQAISDVDVVISCLGQNDKDNPHLLERAARAMARAATEKPDLRYIVVSQGLLFPSRNPFVHGLRLILHRITDDTREMERVVVDSALSWTLVRPPRLTNGAPTRPPKAEMWQMPKGRASMKRSELADFLVTESQQGHFINCVVGVTAK